MANEEATKGWRKFASAKVANVLMLGTIAALGILYIGQVNAAASKALQLRELQETNDRLAMEQGRLEAKIGELRSLSSVLQRQQFLGFVPVGSISYITPVGSAVALR